MMHPMVPTVSVVSQRTGTAWLVAMEFVLLICFFCFDSSPLADPFGGFSYTNIPYLEQMTKEQATSVPLHDSASENDDETTDEEDEDDAEDDEDTEHVSRQLRVESDSGAVMGTSPHRVGPLPSVNSGVN